MRGVIFKGNREAEIREFPDPHAGPGEAVVKIRSSGLCGTDLHRYRAAEPTLMITGHEPCGEIAELGAGAPDGLKIGDRVMVHHYRGCGVCEICSMGYEQLCPEGRVTYGGGSGHGANADYILVPSRTLVHLHDDLTFEEGAAISCGTGTAFGALRRLNVSGRDTLAIFGQGPVGLSATQLATAMGARVIALDVSPERLALAQSFGAAETINPATDEPIAAIKDLTHGEGTDLALDCSGIPDARVSAVRSTRTWGSVCFVGEGNNVTIDVSPDMIRKQLTVMASWTFSTVGQAECAQFIVDRKVAVDQLFTHRFTLDQAEEAYRLFDTQTTGKGVFLM